MSAPTNILVVCTANICRSPVGEVLLKGALDSEKYQVSSAGLAAQDGHAADPAVVETAMARGYDISSHLARRLDAEIASGQALILAMERWQIDGIHQKFPMVRGRAFLIGHWSKREIPDPFRKSKEFHAAVFAMLDDCTREWSDKVRQLFP